MVYKSTIAEFSIPGLAVPIAEIRPGVYRSLQWHTDVPMHTYQSTGDGVVVTAVDVSSKGDNVSGYQ